MLLATAAAVDPSAGLGNLANLLTPALEASTEFSGAFVDLGKKLLAVAFTIELMMMMFQYWIKGGANDLVAKFVRLLIVTSIPLMALHTWPELPNLLANFFEREMAGILTGSHGSTSDLVKKTIQDMFSAAYGMGDNAPPANQGDDGWVVRALMHMFAYVVLFLPLIIVSLALLFALYGPQFMIAIGIILGPVLVAWLPMESMSNLATKWLNYMVTMGISFMVGMTLAAIMIRGITNFTSVVEAQDTALGASLAGAIGLLPTIVALLFLAYMLFKIEQIGAALVGGPSIGGGGGFMAMAAASIMRAGKGGGGGKGGGDKSGPNSPSGGGDAKSADAAKGADMSKDAANASQSAASPANGSSSAGLSQAAGDTTGGAPGASAGGSSFGDKMKSLGNDIKSSKVLNSGPVKAGAMAAAAVAAGPVAAAAVGAYAVSPQLRAGVGKLAGVAAKGGSSGASKLAQKFSGGAPSTSKPSTPPTTSSKG